jgi:histidinol phosphatase-like enzyme (inositol monophosphatase family)
MTAAATLADAIAIAEAARPVALAHFRTRLGVEFKADESPVTAADRGVEEEVRRIIAARFPDHGIFGEEHGVERADGDDLWIVDPIDGTRSFITGHPLFGFLLAWLHRGAARLAVVSIPATGEIFAAEAGGGAFLNGAPIRTSGRTDAAGAAIYVNEGEKIWRARPDVFGRLMSFGTTRRLSYDCYPYGLLAMGHVDVVVDYDLQPYDYHPVALLVAEAGGVMTDWDGNPMGMGHNVPVVAAASAELHAKALAAVRG